ncbi:hypothetical protein [Brevundimonas sp.]|uniref:hypothetical protein n=1 Tax=Brevundimonas sp. TaxID=1871086 RepID=UPI0027300A9A|nr:hypothetical protein [Brevundimonas sp.]MDP1912212.1 hypothetical protein [Brevundimonas sp.]
MQFEEAHEGEYRIFVGAVESRRGEGYTAALVVKRMNVAPGHLREAFRDDSLACGYRWPSPEEAMHYALNRGRELVRSGSDMLAC